MRRRRIAVHAVVAFVVSLVVLVFSGAVGSLIVDQFVTLHASDEIGRVALDGGGVALIVAFPAPFVLAAISTVYAVRRGETCE